MEHNSLNRPQPQWFFLAGTHSLSSTSQGRQTNRLAHRTAEMNRLMKGVSSWSSGSGRVDGGWCLACFSSPLIPFQDLQGEILTVDDILAKDCGQIPSS